MTLPHGIACVLALCSVASSICLAADPSQNVLSGGTFEDSPNGRPTGWTSADEKWTGIRIAGDETRYARLTGRAGAEPRLTASMPIDPAWKWVTLGARMRAPDIQLPAKAGEMAVPVPTVKFVILDTTGKERPAASLSPILEGGYRDWHAPWVVAELKPGDKELRMVISMPLVGAFDVDDVMVIPFDPKDELDPKQIDEIQAAVSAGDAEKVKQLVAKDPDCSKRAIRAMTARPPWARPVGRAAMT